MCVQAANIFVWNTTTCELITMYENAEHELTTLGQGSDMVVATAKFGSNKQDYEVNDKVMKDSVSVRGIREQLDKLMALQLASLATIGHF